MYSLNRRFWSISPRPFTNEHLRFGYMPVCISALILACRLSVDARKDHRDDRCQVFRMSRGDGNYPRRALHKRSAANDIDLNCNEQIFKSEKKESRRKKYL